MNYENGRTKWVNRTLCALYERLGHKQVLFNGISCVTHFVHNLVVGPCVIPTSSTGFGRGWYFAESFEYAKLYAQQGGCIAAHA